MKPYGKSIRKIKSCVRHQSHWWKSAKVFENLPHYNCYFYLTWIYGGLWPSKTENMLTFSWNSAFTKVWLRIYPGSWNFHPASVIFPFLYALKLSLRRGVGGSKIAKTPLRKIKMVPAHWLKNNASNQPDVKSWITVIQYKCGLHVH